MLKIYQFYSIDIVHQNKLKKSTIESKILKSNTYLNYDNIIICLNHPTYDLLVSVLERRYIRVVGTWNLRLKPEKSERDFSSNLLPLLFFFPFSAC